MRSLRRQILVPFVLGVTVLVATVGAVATVSTHHGASEELEARADATSRAFTLWRLERQSALEQDAVILADQMAEGPADGRASLLTLPSRIAGHDLVLAVDARDDVTFVAQGADWARLPAASGLVERAQEGLVSGGMAVTGDGTPVLMGAVPVRLPEGRFGAVLIGEVLDEQLLAQLSAPLELDMAVEATASAPPPDQDGRRRFTYRAQVARGSPDARLVTTLTTARVRAATGQAALTALGTGGAIAALLVVLVAGLLRGAVLAPLTSLRRAIREATEGNLHATVPLVGPRELREIATGFGQMTRTVAEQKARLEALAASDPLTGLANHRRFHETLEAAIDAARRAAGSVAVVTLDLDRFKQFNDEHGHPCGDEVLRATAGALCTVVRADDLVARVGGEKFALVLPGAGHELAWQVAERARAAVAQIGVPGFALTGSAGIACFPVDAPDPATLFERADGALYAAKRGGRDQTRRYDHRQGARSFSDRERAEVVEVLRRPDAIMPVFQPLVDLASGRLVGYEALSRFAALPARAPEAWFAQARRCGLGHELEAAALKAALEELGRPTGTFLSVNLSPSALISAPVLRVLPKDLDGIMIEVTEHEVVGDDDDFRRLLADLRARGARIALDDAGAGYAGLQAVMRLDLDVIKLDRSLVDGVHGDLAKVALVESFVRFARRTGAVVCAEGIETLDDLNVLADLDVTYGQGYVLARPAPAWAPVSASVADVLLRRSVASGGDLSAGELLPETGDRRLEALSCRMSGVASSEELPGLFALIGEELRADDLCFSNWDAARDIIKVYGDHGWTPEGEEFAVSDFPATARVLRTQESAQVLVGDPRADRAEVGLLVASPYRSLLMVPVIARGRTVGLLELHREREEPWQRTDVNRARIIGYQLGPVLEALEGAPLPPGLATVTSLEERRERVS